MADKSKRFTQISVLPPTHRKTSLLASAFDVDIYELVEKWADAEWQEAKQKGLVTDAMLQSPDQPSPSEKKRTAASARQIVLAV